MKAYLHFTLLLVLLASMAMTVGAGMRWGGVALDRTVNVDQIDLAGLQVVVR